MVDRSALLVDLLVSLLVTTCRPSKRDSQSHGWAGLSQTFALPRRVEVAALVPELGSLSGEKS